MSRKSYGVSLTIKTVDGIKAQLQAYNKEHNLQLNFSAFVDMMLSKGLKQMLQENKQGASNVG